MNFEEACTEMEYIINNMEPSERAKIPQEVKKFFTENKDHTYSINLDCTRNLSEEKLKEETEAFIEIIYNKYLKNIEKDKIEANIENNTDKELTTISKKENFFNKLISKIRKFFKK